MTCEPESENAKRARRAYVRDISVAAAIYVAVVFAAALAIRNLQLPQWAIVGLSILPTAPALLMLRAYLIYVSALDEFQRRIQSQALIIASAVTVFGSFTYGFLEEWADFPHLPLIWVFPVFCAVFGVAHLIIRRRYQ